MKSLIFAAGLATLMVPMGAATASVYTLGGPLAQNCYRAAESRDARSFAIEGCTRALNEGLALPDRAATYVNRGIVQMVGGHSRAADADFDAALAIDLEPVRRLSQQGLSAPSGRPRAGGPAAASKGH